MKMFKNLSEGWVTTISGIVTLIIAVFVALSRIDSGTGESLGDFVKEILLAVAGIIQLFAKDPNQE